MSSVNQPLPTNGTLSAREWKTWVPGTVFAAASRTNATYTSQEYFNPRHKGLRLIIDVNSVGAAGTLDVKIQVKDPITGTWYDWTEAAATQITAAGQAVFTIYPGIEEDAGANIANRLPITFRIVAVVGANAVDFSIWGELLA